MRLPQLKRSKCLKDYLEGIHLNQFPYGSRTFFDIHIFSIETKTMESRPRIRTMQTKETTMIKIPRKRTIKMMTMKVNYSHIYQFLDDGGVKRYQSEEDSDDDDGDQEELIPSC